MPVYFEPRINPEELSGNKAIFYAIERTNADYAMNTMRTVIMHEFGEAAGHWTTNAGGVMQWTRTAAVATSYCLTIRAAW